MTSDDELRRAPGTTLAVRAEDALDSVGDAVVWLTREAVPAGPLGAEQLVRDWKHWQSNRARLTEIAADKALAARQGMVPARLEQARREATDVAWWRMRLSWAVLAGAVLGLTVCSVLGFWTWEQWRWGGPALTFAQLAAGKYYRQRWALRTAWVWLPVFVALDISGWRWWPWWVAGGLLLAACVARGLLMARDEPEAPARVVEAESGVSLPKLWETVKQRLFEEKVTVQHQHTRLLVVHGREVGAAFGMVPREPMTDKAVGAVAREVHVGRKWVRYVHPADEAVGELLVYWANPLAQVPPPPRRQFGDLRYTSSFSIGQDDGGLLDELCIAYTNVVIFGRTGSGKSSVGRVVIDAVEVMPDCDFFGIDTVGMSTIGAQRRRLGPGRVACGPGEIKAAEGILDFLIAECARRSDALADQEDYDEDGEVDERFITDDRAGRRGVFLYLGEYHDFCQYESLVEKLLFLAGINRKHAVTIVAEAPTLAKDELGAGRLFLGKTMLRIALACSNSDVVQGLGAGALDEGWRPDHLQPESEGKRNDAGIGYAYGGGRNRPKMIGFHPLGPDEAAERRRAVRVSRNRWYDLPADAEGDRRDDPVRVVSDDADVVDAEIVSEEDVARESAIHKAIGLCGDRPGLTPSEASDGLTADERAHVRRAAPSRSTYFPDSGASGRAHRLSDLVNALSASTGRSAA